MTPSSVSLRAKLGAEKRADSMEQRTAIRSVVCRHEGHDEDRLASSLDCTDSTGAGRRGRGEAGGWGCVGILEMKGWIDQGLAFASTQLPLSIVT